MVAVWADQAGVEAIQGPVGPWGNQNTRLELDLKFSVQNMASVERITLAQPIMPIFDRLSGFVVNRDALDLS